jgi:Lon protease-like protein
MTGFMRFFPLELVVFPEEKLNLHIFEERYKALINDCFQQHKTFAVPAYINGKVSEYATEVEILKIDKLYPDGKMDICTKGLQIVRILDFQMKNDQFLYPAGIVTTNHPYVEITKADEATSETLNELERLVSSLSSILNIHKNIIPSDTRLLSFKIAHYFGMKIADEYDLLLTLNEDDRQQKLISFIKAILPSIEQRETIRKKIQLNGHFKHVFPPDF